VGRGGSVNEKVRTPLASHEALVIVGGPSVSSAPAEGTDTKKTPEIIDATSATAIFRRASFIDTTPACEEHHPLHETTLTWTVTGGLLLVHRPETS
jgi:hypothetical protein